MKVGSLVELVDDDWPPKSYKNLVKYPEKNIVYTIRDIYDIKPEAGVWLEEIDNRHLADATLDKHEPNFGIKRFRELQPPIANIEEHINENTLTPELV